MPLLQKSRFPLLLSLVVVVGALLRFYQITHGLGFHPDERGMLNIAVQLSWDDLKPESFHYGSFAFYLLWFSGQMLGVWREHYASYDGMYELGRCIAVAFSMLAVLLTYALGKRLYQSKAVALLAAALLCFNVFHLQLSRFYTVDILLTTLVLGALFCILALASSNSLKAYLLSGLMIGLALTTKISALSLFLPAVVAVLLYLYRRKKWFVTRTYALSAAAVAAVFLTAFLVEPFLFFNFEQFLSDNLMQIRMVRGDWRPPYALQYQGTAPYLYPIEQMLKYTMGYPLGISVLLGVLLVFYRQLRWGVSEEIIVLTWVLAVFFSVGGLQVKFPRYLLILYPVLFLFAAKVYGDIALLLDRSGKGRMKWLLAILLVLWTAFGALSWVQIYSREHVWYTASRWMYEELEPGTVLIDVHWDDRLPVRMKTGNQNRFVCHSMPLYESDTPEKLREFTKTLAGGDYLVFPTRRLYGSIPRVAGEHPFTARFVSLLFAEKLGFRLEKRFKVRPALAGVVFDDDLADESFVVYDHPKVSIFKNEKRLEAEEIEKRILDSLESGGHALPSFEQILKH